ncbi:hypothetical protein GCM10010873_09960 [Cypionkella aquatica]|uniref:DUF1349 domain-containing protein n=1 Tax=Cypionkella aquatica TaxID=1756042 RepID=A0AA37TWH1_9RHOB|nr:DUF1349 domain-containing protein [Cypionkella aquatica]GLS86022.1 hypothetical protein GCM10010873_09960 [Cypionkella aquatica]
MNWQDMNWLNPPAAVAQEAGGLLVTTGENTDFWHGTYYGFHHHNGHFLHAPAQGDFSLETAFRAGFSAQYDQAGLMIRADESHWVKCGIEYVGGTAFLAVVVTNGMSDWSQLPMPDYAGQLRLRLTRVGDAVWVQYLAGDAWRMLRLAYFPPELAVEAGVMCCSPSRAGLQVLFENVALTSPFSTKAY